MTNEEILRTLSAGGYIGGPLDYTGPPPDAAYFEEGKAVEDCRMRFSYAGSPFFAISDPVLPEEGSCTGSCSGVYMDEDGFHPKPCVKTSEACRARYEDIAPSLVRQSFCRTVGETLDLYMAMRHLWHDQDAAMIHRDGPAQPKPAAIQAPLLIESRPDTAGLMVVAEFGKRW
jgi:hypothetical protein